jgi:type III pantothenate kinase
MNLIIDVGNSRVKLAVFNHLEMVYNEVVTNKKLIQRLNEIIIEFNCLDAIISSVGNLKKSQIKEIKQIVNLIELSFETNIPFINKYGTPETLGVDRIALVVAAVEKYKNSNVLVIDAGTCITYDFVNAKKEYYGGAISPGLKMRFKALNKFTKSLPLLEPEESINLMGNTTNESIQSGIVFGVISEIDSFIHKYREKNADLTIVLTGGDVKFLAKRLKNTIFANPNFLLEGLNHILTYNLSK